MRLKDRVALITGGNSGIGLATARLFVMEGARVVITGRNQKTLDKAAAELGENVAIFRGDVTEVSAPDAAVALAVEQFGRLDIVFANAGIAAVTPVGPTTPQAFNEILRTNVTAAFLTVQAAVPHLTRGASIIFNGSVDSRLGPPGLSAYAASKGAIHSMTRTLASELAPRGTRVNVVAPGETRTPIWTPIAPTPESYDDLDKKLSQAIPLGRLCEPDEVARGVLYLASDDASAVTASELVLDGGHLGAPFGAPIFSPIWS